MERMSERVVRRAEEKVIDEPIDADNSTMDMTYTVSQECMNIQPVNDKLVLQYNHHDE